MYMSYSALLSARGRRERAPVRPRRGLALTPPVVSTRWARGGRIGVPRVQGPPVRMRSTDSEFRASSSLYVRV